MVVEYNPETLRFAQVVTPKVGERQIQLAYKYRLYPNKKQTERLQSTLNTCRFLYNNALWVRREAGRIGKEYGVWPKGSSYMCQQNELLGCKVDNPEFNYVYSQVLQAVLKRLDRAFDNFFQRVKKGEKPGYPRFKSKNRYHSILYPQSGFSLDGDSLHLSKIGNFKIKLHRPIKGKVKTLAITKEVDKWYACFSVKVAATSKPKQVKTAVGIDVGLNSFVTLSTGEQIENPKWFRNSERKLAHHQKCLSQKKLRSQNRNKQRAKVAKLHKRITNQRKDFHHKVSRSLVDKYDLIAYEDLNIKGMVRNHHLAKSISDAGWAQFIAFVCYKAEEAGGTAIAVNPSGTSVDCSRCGFPVSKTLATRIHKCPNCGLIMDRDENAAKNILARALPQELRDIKLVEIEPLLFREQVWSEKQEAACVS